MVVGLTSGVYCRQLILSKVRERVHSHVKRPGLPHFSEGQRRIPIADIPGIKESSWESRLDEAQVQSLQSHFRDILNHVKEHHDAWPFLEPVDPVTVHDYYTVIKNPIDLSLIEKRLDDGFYITKELFFADFRRMFDNCRTYNNEETVFFKCATVLQRVVCDRGGAPYFR
jgi:histone acetyltransferase